jgi:hypothetical protein
LYNQTINDHFYTTSQAEAQMAQDLHGYRIESVMGYVERYQQDGTVAIIRMWNPHARKHFYTTSATEAASAQASGFVWEGSIGFIQHDTAPAGGQGPDSPIYRETDRAVYRMYNNSLRKHFYTIDRTEMINVLGMGYRLEGDLGILYDFGYEAVP